MERIWYSPDFRAACEALGLTNVDSFARHFAGNAAGGEDVIHGTGVLAVPGAGEVQVHYKRYQYRRASWRFVFRRSKAWREALSYAHLAEIGVPCGVAVAWGEQRDGLHRLRGAFILTVEIPATTSLVEWMRGLTPRNGQATAARDDVRLRLALITRQAHDGGFLHCDLFLRNVLVSSRPAARPEVWWIDSPRGHMRWPGPLRQLGIVRDLASLDKDAGRLSTRTERLRFLLDYAASSRLDGRLRSLARRVLAYKARRWPNARH